MTTLSQTVKQLGVPFEVIVTSEQTKSYKPDRAIFDRAVKLIGEHPSSIIHIAEGRCEATPARALGMRSIWVNRSPRSDDGSNAQPNAVVSNLTQIVDFVICWVKCGARHILEQIRFIRRTTLASASIEYGLVYWASESAMTELVSSCVFRLIRQLLISNANGCAKAI